MRQAARCSGPQGAACRKVLHAAKRAPKGLELLRFIGSCSWIERLRWRAHPARDSETAILFARGTAPRAPPAPRRKNRKAKAKPETRGDQRKRCEEGKTFRRGQRLQPSRSTKSRFRF